MQCVRKTQIRRMLKNIILLSLAITQILCMDTKFFEECAEELKLEINQDTGAVSKKSDTTCLMKCISEKEGIVDADGVSILENHHKTLHPYLKTCEEQATEKEPCKRVHEIDDCFDDNYDAISKDVAKFCAEETKTERKESDLLMDFEDFGKSCFHKCVLNIMGVLDDKGDVSFYDLVVNEDYVFRPNLAATVEKCEVENVQDDDCLRSMKRITCFATKFN